jgi:Domain of unknown function (DUF4202)
VAQFENGRHLTRTRDWLLQLDPDAAEALRIAALTHDVERSIPGGPVQRADRPANDRAYRDTHAARSAEIVSAWLAGQGAGAELISNVADLVRMHEWGGSPSANLLQAADSISFLETTAPLARIWIKDRGYTRQRSEQQFNWMLTRIQLPEARRIAQPLFDAAMAALDG